MSIIVKHEADGSVTITCGTQTVTLQMGGEPIATQQPVKVKRLIGKGTGHLAVDIPREGSHDHADNEPSGNDISLPVNGDVNLDEIAVQTYAHHMLVER